MTKVGGLDLFPPEPGISPVEYVESMDAVGIDYDVMSPESVMARWPQFRLPEGTHRSSTSATRRSCRPAAAPGRCRRSRAAAEPTCARTRR